MPLEKLTITDVDTNDSYEVLFNPTEITLEKKTPWREHAITACHRQFAQISDARWLYGAWAHENPPKLFDREADPQQQRDALNDHPQVARKLHDAMIAELRRLQASEDWVEALDAKPALAGL